MTEQRMNEISQALMRAPLNWAMRWCDARGKGGCACMGCADTATRCSPDRATLHPEFSPHTIPPLTKEEWQEWWRIQGQRLGSPAPPAEGDDSGGGGR